MHLEDINNVKRVLGGVTIPISDRLSLGLVQWYTLLWPCMWSIAMAAPTGCLPDLATMGLFSVGAVVMRGAGCTINDYWDRDIDGHVTRTAARPIANGEVSPTAALAFFAAQCVTGLGVLLQLPPQTLVLGAASLPLVVAYPLAKRYTKYPQFVLGLTFNWGAMLGWAAVRNGARNGQALQLDAGRGVTTASGSAGEGGAGDAEWHPWQRHAGRASVRTSTHSPR